ncbi:late secretory pathway protein avl9 [Halocaridina rubra]|uniref:Late secretory pathway protein avl9 n=1 Tax=Halocaridina rubra TaxID=373956 RepID=A0AAN8X894_HALRR
MEEGEKDPIALHVIVVGFHHKKGMQVEYSYPPLTKDNSCDLPEQWRHLPSLCLPDGAHNHEADTIFFHLPHLTKPDQTVFGVSCYRQIDAEKVTNRTADITRNTVQKSVCVLSTLPIYGYIQERLQVTTKVYFKGADFSDVQDLEGLYHDLNTTNWRDKLNHESSSPCIDRVHLTKLGCGHQPALLCYQKRPGDSVSDACQECVYVSDAVRVFGRNILVLFKLILLERRVLFYHSPVGPLVRTITSLMALFPENFPNGLAHAASLRILNLAMKQLHQQRLLDVEWQYLRCRFTIRRGNSEEEQQKRPTCLNQPLPLTGHENLGEASITWEIISSQHRQNNIIFLWWSLLKDSF